MKNLLSGILFIFLLFLCSIVFANDERPRVDIDLTGLTTEIDSSANITTMADIQGQNITATDNIGAYGLTTNDLTVNNDTTLHGKIGGWGLYEYPNADKSFDNIIKWTEDLSNALWVKTNCNAVDTTNNGFARLTQSSAGTAFLAQELVGAGIGGYLTGKNMTILVRCKSSSVDYQYTGLKLWDRVYGGFIGQKDLRLPNDVFSTYRVKTTQVAQGTFNVGVSNTVAAANFGVDFKYIAFLETLEPAFLNIGDSIAYAAYKTVSHGFVTLIYAELFAAEHNVDYTQNAVSGYTLSQIYTKLISSISDAKGEKILFFNGGTNDVTPGATTSADMITTATNIVNLGLENFSLVVGVTIPIVPTWGGDTLIRANAYNAGLRVLAAATDGFYLVDCDEIFDGVTFYGPHPDPLGHRQILAEINRLISLPKNVETYEYTKTTDTYRIETMQHSNLKGDIDWTKVRVITEDYDVLQFPADVIIVMDGQSNTVQSTLPIAPADGDVYQFAVIDDTYECTVNPNGGSIDNSTDNLTITTGYSPKMQYFIGYGWKSDGIDWTEAPTKDISAKSITTADNATIGDNIVVADNATVGSNLIVAGGADVAGMVKQGSTYHASGGFDNESETVTVTTVDVWYPITNATNDLWVGDPTKCDGITLADDNMTFANTGFYPGVVSMTVAAGSQKDFQIRLYNITQTIYMINHGW